jgi:hypothetical protein
MARSTNEQNKTQNCNTRKASQKATQSTTQKHKLQQSRCPANGTGFLRGGTIK